MTYKQYYELVDSVQDQVRKIGGRMEFQEITPGGGMLRLTVDAPAGRVWEVNGLPNLVLDFSDWDMAARERTVRQAQYLIGQGLARPEVGV